MPAVHRIIIAVALWVVAILLLDIVGWYYFAERLVYQLEWTFALFALIYFYRRSVSNMFIDWTLFFLCLFQAYSLADACFVMQVKISHRHLQYECIEEIVYQTQPLSLVGYWMIVWAAIICVFTYIACSFTPKK